MLSRHLGYEIAVLLVVCTVAMFLFPTATGSYSAVHGPVTALLSFRTKLKTWLGMLLAALRWLGRALPDGCGALRSALEKIFPPHSVPTEQIAVLRC